MLEKATAQKDLPVSRGMSPTLLDDLAAALKALDQPLSRRWPPRSPSRCGCSTGAGSVRGQRGADGGVGSARNLLGPFKPKGDQIVLAA